jgi:hypothetical protein
MKKQEWQVVSGGVYFHTGRLCKHRDCVSERNTKWQNGGCACTETVCQNANTKWQNGGCASTETVCQNANTKWQYGGCACRHTYRDYVTEHGTQLQHGAWHKVQSTTKDGYLGEIICRVGQSCTYTPYMTAYLVKFLSKVPKIHRINIALTNFIWLIITSHMVYNGHKMCICLAQCTLPGTALHTHTYTHTRCACKIL